MYTVQFVGLMCFFKQPNARIVLLPDGTHMEPKHSARIAVDKSMVANKSGAWPAVPASKGDFLLDEDFDIVIEQADQPGQLTLTDHKPISLGPNFAIDLNTAKTIGRIAIRQGMLRTFRYPGTNDTPEASTISQLDVMHSANIHIRATGRKNPQIVRTIELKAGTEIAIVNDSADKDHDHFHIYEQLGHGPGPLGTTPNNPPGFLRSQSQHRVFHKPDPIVDGVRCPNTGCCP
jgi:hypothetical protein